LRLWDCRLGFGRRRSVRSGLERNGFGIRPFLDWRFLVLLDFAIHPRRRRIVGEDDLSVLAGPLIDLAGKPRRDWEQKETEEKDSDILFQVVLLVAADDVPALEKFIRSRQKSQWTYSAVTERAVVCLREVSSSPSASALLEKRKVPSC
jgi:hypothetical protein